MVNISNPFNGNEKFFPNRLRGNVLTGDSSTQFAVAPQPKQPTLQLPVQPQGQQQLVNNNSIIGNASPIPTNVQPIQQQGNGLGELLLQGAQPQQAPQQTPGIFENPQFLQTLGYIAQAFDPNGPAGRLSSQILDQQSNNAFSKALANTGVFGGDNLPAGITPEGAQAIADIKQREQQNNLFIQKLLQDAQLAGEANQNRLDVANIQAGEGPLIDLQRQLLGQNVDAGKLEQIQREQDLLTQLASQIGTPDETGINVSMTPEQKQMFAQRAQVLGISPQMIQSYLGSIQETPEPGKGFLSNLIEGLFSGGNKQPSQQLSNQNNKQNIPSTVPGGGFTPPKDLQNSVDKTTEKAYQKAVELYNYLFDSSSINNSVPTGVRTGVGGRPIIGEEPSNESVFTTPDGRVIKAADLNTLIEEMIKKLEIK